MPNSVGCHESSILSEGFLENELKRFFGYNTFRSYQKEIIQALLNKEDVFALLPTGAGKSLCYQLPALLQEGTAIVVSPLISLMQDQVVSLFKNGISAAFVNSSLSYQDHQDVMNQLADYKLLYVAPERLLEPQFLEKLKSIQISFFVIDEAHCISQWGHSFRVEYRRLSLLKQHFPKSPIIALTATATPEVEKDILIQLAMKSPRIIKGSFDRPNLTIKLAPKSHSEKQLKAFLLTRKNESGIIYSSTRKGVENTFSDLQEAGYSVGKYHAGLSEQERALSQHAFLHEQVSLMVATVAFGMGIHKPDIRFIVHLDMPRTIEQYYQEIGRAGRDGLPAECLMLYGMQDFIIYKSFLEDLEDPLIRKQMKDKTESIYRFCTSMKCRRKELLRYFGEHFSQAKCEACDNCLEEFEQIDGTIIAKKILSCVYRLKQNVGIRMVGDVLRGSKNQSLLNRGYQNGSTYGILTEFSEQEMRYYIESLIHLGFLHLTEGEYPVLKWNKQSEAIINNQLPVSFRKRIFKVSKEEKESSKRKETVVFHYDTVLFESLRQLRLECAREEAVPPFVVFSDRALQEMAVHFPRNQEEFANINGVGPIKWLKYGQKFLKAILSHSGQKPTIERDISPVSLQRIQSMNETVALFQKGDSLEQIIEKRQLARSTIITHLVEAIEQGIDIDLSFLIPIEKQSTIRQVITQVGADRLAPIKEKLPLDYHYEEIRLVAAYSRRSRLT